MESGSTPMLDGWCHDVRTATSILLHYIDMLAKEPSDSRETLASLQANGFYLLELVEQMSDGIKQELSGSNTGVSLDKLIHQVISTVQSASDCKGLNLAHELSVSLPLVHDQNTLAIKRIMVNLLSNAIKFSNQGDIIVKAGLCGSHQTDLAINDNDHFFIEVIDDGPGMTKQQAERFGCKSAGKLPERLDGKNRKSLGLSTAKSLTESLGGIITLTTQLGKGTKVRVILPNFRPKLQHVRSVSSDSGISIDPNEDFYKPKLKKFISPDKSPAIRIDKKQCSCNTLPVSQYSQHKRDLYEQDVHDHIVKPFKILLVDDDPDMRSIMSYMLASYGIQVHAVSSSGKALMSDLISYDGILLDLHMPDLSGGSCASIIKKLGYTKAVIAFTATDFPPDWKLREEYMAFDGIVDKTSGEKFLLAELKKYFQIEFEESKTFSVETSGVETSGTEWSTRHRKAK